MEEKIKNIFYKLQAQFRNDKTAICGERHETLYRCGRYFHPQF